MDGSTDDSVTKSDREVEIESERERDSDENRDESDVDSNCENAGLDINVCPIVQYQ
jgi:hypothetical protein